MIRKVVQIITKKRRAQRQKEAISYDQYWVDSAKHSQENKKFFLKK